MALEDEGPNRPFTRTWYRNRGELEAHDIISSWLRDQMYLEFAMRQHEFIWGIPCGPALNMLPSDVLQEYWRIRMNPTQHAAEQMYPNHHAETALANYLAGHEVWDSNGDAW